MVHLTMLALHQREFMVMLLCQEESMQGVISFSMNKNARDIMKGKPVDDQS